MERPSGWAVHRPPLPLDLSRLWLDLPTSGRWSSPGPRRFRERRWAGAPMAGGQAPSGRAREAETRYEAHRK